MSTTPTPRDELLHVLFTTALEGGIGYWSVCERYHWSNDDEGRTGHMDEDWFGFYAIITETEGNLLRARIDRSVMARGYSLATSTDWRSRLCWSSEPPPPVVTPYTDWDFDAGDADMIVQLGLFGDVVYG